MQKLDRPSNETREHERDVGDHDEPLVRRRIASHSEGKCDEHREDEYHVGVDEKEQLFEARRNASPQNIGASHQTGYDHCASQWHRDDTETAMEVDAVSGNQRHLGGKQQHPEGGYECVNVNDLTRQERLDHPGEVVGGRKAHEHRGEQKHGHTCEKQVFVGPSH